MQKNIHISCIMEDLVKVDLIYTYIYIYISTRVLPFLTPTWFRLSDLLQE